MLLGAVLSFWCAGLAAGAIALWRYSGTPGEAKPAPSAWPANGLIPRKPGRVTLVMLAHPHCPCTRASLAELERLMARGDADAWVLFLSPAGTPTKWNETPLWQVAAAIPGVHPMADPEGNVAKIFGAETSGHVLLYDGSGLLRFSGGITAARGHEGPSAGGDAVTEILRGGEPEQSHALTFGCALQTEGVSR